jgi:uncharacterized protein (TIGR02996 family)
MNDEDAFQRAIDAEPGNLTLKRVFADWLEEQGDWRAAGYRWMAEHEKWPFDWDQDSPAIRFNTFDWYITDGKAVWTVPEYCRLPATFRRVFATGNDWIAFPSRQAAEEALCKVIETITVLPQG